MSLRAKVIRGAFWSLVQGWGSQFGSLAVFFLLARLLTPDDFGLVALASVFLAFMQIFLTQGFADALVQRETLQPQHLDAAFWTSVGAGGGLMLLGFGSAPLVASFFQTPALAPVLCALSSLLLVSSLGSIQQAQLQRKFAFKALAARNLLGIASGGLAGIGLALAGWGVWALVGQQLVQEVVSTVVLWQASAWRPRWRFSWQHWRELSNFGLNQLAFGFLAFFNNRADDFLIGYYLGPTSLGYYSLAYRILTAMTNLLINSSNQIALPAFSRLQTEPERFRAAFYRATQLTSTIAFPIFGSVAVLAPELINTLFGEQWRPAVPVLQILAVVGALRSVTYFKSSVLLAMGKPHWRLYLGCLSATLNVVGFYIAVRWGIVAVALAYLARATIVFPISQGAVSHLIDAPLKQYIRNFLPTTLASLGASAAIAGTRFLWGDPLSAAGTIVLGSILGGGIYCCLLYCFAPDLFRQFWDLLATASRRAKSQGG